jgi:hypothetical protein
LLGRAGPLSSFATDVFLAGFNGLLRLDKGKQRVGRFYMPVRMDIIGSVAANSPEEKTATDTKTARL